MCVKGAFLIASVGIVVLVLVVVLVTIVDAIVLGVAASRQDSDSLCFPIS